MNQTQFLENLKALKDRYNWYLDMPAFAEKGALPAIRAKNKKGNCHCPITALYAATRKKHATVHSYEQNSRSLGIDEHLKCQIIDAADGFVEDNATKRLRARMLNILGLKP